MAPFDYTTLYSFAIVSKYSSILYRLHVI